MFKYHYFILCPSFHGATLLSKLLNAHPEVISLGDTYPAKTKGEVCGCKKYVFECDYWKNITQNLDLQEDGLSHILPSYPKMIKNTFLRRVYNMSSIGIIRLVNSCFSSQESKKFCKNLHDFTASVYKQHLDEAPSVFVDGVKSIGRVKTLIAGGFSVNGIIHFVRNPHDFSKSAIKSRSLPNSFKNYVQGLLTWRYYHSLTRKLEKKVPLLHISYEDLVKNPDIAMQKIFSFMNIEERSFDKLRESLDQPWHFLGNSTLFDFKGVLNYKTYPATKLELILSKITTIGCSTN